MVNLAKSNSESRVVMQQLFEVGYIVDPAHRMTKTFNENHFFEIMLPDDAFGKSSPAAKPDSRQRAGLSEALRSSTRDLSKFQPVQPQSTMPRSK
jgi:hypothetical protein